jgi:hypothetical protein
MHKHGKEWHKHKQRMHFYLSTNTNKLNSLKGKCFDRGASSLNKQSKSMGATVSQLCVAPKAKAA